MTWQIILALVLAIPVMLIPVALIWYINVGGIYVMLKETHRRDIARKAAQKVKA